MRYLTCVETAKMVRAAVKAAFPGVKFSVRSHQYAGGASIDVTWTDGPTTAEVDKVVQPYEGATFDGMTDMKSYRTATITSPDGTTETVYHGADFVHTSRELSPAYRAKLIAMAQARIPGFDETDHNRVYPPTCFDGIAKVWTGGGVHSVVTFLSRQVAP